MLLFLAFAGVAVLAVLMKRMNTDGINDPHAVFTPADDSGVVALIRQQKLIEAIKLYRELHNVGLRQAKDAVQALAEGKPPGGTLTAAEMDKMVLFSIRYQTMKDAIIIYKALHKTDDETAAKAVEELAKTLKP